MPSSGTDAVGTVDVKSHHLDADETVAKAQAAAHSLRPSEHRLPTTVVYSTTKDMLHSQKLLTRRLAQAIHERGKRLSVRVILRGHGIDHGYEGSEHYGLA